MDKVLNVVYDAFGAPEIYYQGPEGTVWYSNKRNENTYNVYMSACNNIYSYNYLTEKLPQTIYGGALPLYMGCHNIDELAPEHTIFDLRNFVIKDSGKWKLLERPLLEALNSFTKEKFERYQETTYQYLKSPTGISYHADMKRFLRQMLKEYYP